MMSTRGKKMTDSRVEGRFISYDTHGAMYGPGIRFVLSLQGCALRCKFCSNPDSWSMSGGNVTTVEDILAEIEPFVSYYKSSGGGITVTGGEPTLQAPFVAALFREAKRRFGLHTVLDTSGFCKISSLDASGLLDATDLVVLDLKQINEERHQSITTQSNKQIIRFACHLSNLGQKMWIRHILVPGETDFYQDLLELGQFMSTLENVEKLEIFPYHGLRINKWQPLKHPYTFQHVTTPTESDIERAYRLVEAGRKELEEYEKNAYK